MKTWSKIIYLIMAFFVWSYAAMAQIPGMRKYTQFDGYTATKGYEIEQDEKGNILLGTDNGGMIFDGKKFRVLLDTRRVLDAEILFVRPVGNSRILLLPLTGAACYLDKGKLVTAREDKRLVRTKAGGNNCWKDPVIGAWWLTGNFQDKVYRFSKQKIATYQAPELEMLSYVHVINNRVYGFTKEGQCNSYSMHTKTFKKLYGENGEVFNKGKDKRLVFLNAEYLLGDKPGNDKKELYLYRLKTSDSMLRLVRKIAPPFTIDLRMSVIHNHSLWLKLKDASGILYSRGVLEEKWKPSWHHLKIPEAINSLFIDRDNNLWLSASNNALYFLSEKHFKNLLLTGHFPFRDKIPQAISGDAQGRLYISYLNDPRIVCMHGNNVQTISLGQGFDEGSRRILTFNNRYLLLFDRVPVLFDTERGGVARAFPFGTMNEIKGACKINENAVVIACIDGVYFIENIFAPHTEQVDREDSKERIFKHRATAVGTLNNEQVLIGTPAGLFIKQGIYEPEKKINHVVLSECNIVDIQAAWDGSVLVATNASGLFALFNDGSGIKKISTPNDIGQIKCIYMENDSTCWLATDNGAYVLSFDRTWSVRSAKNYNFYNGLPSNSVTDIYVHSDTAYFTTMQGLGIIPLKDSLWLQMAAPGIFVNSVQVDTTTIYEPDSTVQLRNDQNNILVSLSAISYESLGNISYYYKLSPLHDQWIQTTNPDIRFTELPPGTYTFKAYATNAKGIKSKDSIVLNIHIQPALWQTFYFKAAVFVLLAVSLLYFFRCWILRREKRRYIVLQQKKHLAELELEAIKAQINPHFIYNCLNSIKYLNYTGEYSQSQQYLSLFARLIRMTMQYSRQTFITLSEEVEYLSGYLELEKLRFKDKLQYSIIFEENIDKNIQLPALLLQPYVENALKHGLSGKKKGGAIYIAFQRSGNALHILIKDNGPGFSHLQSSGTLGMHLAGTRALSYNELFNMNIQVSYYNQQDNDPGVTGAIVKITIDNIL